MTGLQVKIAALLLMFMDHIGALFMVPGSGIWLLARGLGRLSFPLYAYLASQGIRHTHDAWAYCGRLLGFAFLSEFLFDMAFFGHAPAFVHQNVFFTLAFSVAAFLPWKVWIKPERRGQKGEFKIATFFLVLCMGTAAQSIHADYGILGVLLIGTMVFADGNLVVMMLCVWCFLSLKTEWLVLDLQQRIAVSGAIALLWAWIVGMDNGRPGNKKWRKWFYMAYPVHLAALWYLRVFLGI